MLPNNPFPTPVPSLEKLEDRTFVSAKDLGTPAEDGLVYLDAADCPVLELGGIDAPKSNCGEYYRLDASKKETYSDFNRSLAECTPGTTLRFITDATSVTLDVKLRAAIAGMNHFTNRGVYGFDILIGTGTARKYIGKQMQTFVNTTEFMKDALEMPAGLKEIQINFPLYGGVKSVFLGFAPDAKIALPTKRAYKPIAFYGSSITQGGCVSRPGNSYCNVVCRELDADCRNLGFSGSALGEQSVAEYIGSLDLAAFVMDYDYNARSEEELANTHYPFYETVRRLNPDLPILMMTHVFSFDDRETDANRVKIIRDSYEKALANGDRHVRFLDGTPLFRGPVRDLCTVDALHPNDLGQYIMACEVYKHLITMI